MSDCGKKGVIPFWVLPVILTWGLCACRSDVVLEQGVLDRSVVFTPGGYHVDPDPDSAYLHVCGNDIEIDFNGAVLDGRKDGMMPDGFKGVAIHVSNSKNVTIRNLTVHGFRIALLAENVENLQIIHCNFSYNYRPKLNSKWDRESLSDWLYYHHNEHGEWMRYGAAVYLKDCNHALVRDVLCHQGFNGLLMAGCDSALIYNNDLSYNSGLGIGLYRSAHNRIMHNKLDWNARGYSHGKYARGQDSAAILLYEQSSGNTIAYNSATHSGDGLFLWAGQTTMDTGLGGCDSNLIYRNDFSHSIANGVEATFSSNLIIENKLNDSRYGVWGGYSHHTVIRGNEIDGCDYGIAIEHGNHNTIEGNIITDCPVGVQLWQRAGQPPDWPYTQVRDVRSRNYVIRDNRFVNVGTAVEASGTDSIFTGGNVFEQVEVEMASPQSPSVYVTEVPEMGWKSAHIILPRPLPDGRQVDLPAAMERGRRYIIINEWGPYSFRYPNLVLRKREHVQGREVLRFELLGQEGRWSAGDLNGFLPKDQLTGPIPDSLDLTLDDGQTVVSAYFIYEGNACVTQFGDTIPSGQPYVFGYRESGVRTQWDVNFYSYDRDTDPLTDPEAFTRRLSGPPVAMQRSDRLAFRWWNAPLEEVPSDMFAIVATTQITTTAGEYLFQVESDDGIRVWVDGKKILERWDVHTPVVDEVSQSLTEGVHQVRVEYFEAAGLAVLDVNIVADAIEIQ